MSIEDIKAKVAGLDEAYRQAQEIDDFSDIAGEALGWLKSLIQAIYDPENQPNQWGIVTSPPAKASGAFEGVTYPNARYDNGWYYCWLIERRDMPQPMWFTADCTWTTDAWKALWFARHEDADASAGECQHDAIACEHGFALFSDETKPISTQVMNPPADKAEAGNLANSAPLQSDPDDQRRGMTGVSSGPEAGPVTATQQCDHVGFYFCKRCGKDLTPDIPYADDVGSPTQYQR